MFRLVGLTGPHSNYKILSEKINALKLTISIEASPAPELTDLSYDPNSTIKSIKQQQKHHFSEKEIAEMIRRYSTGETVYQLAIAFNCHRSTVSAVLKRNGVKVTLVKSEKMFNPAEVGRLIRRPFLPQSELAFPPSHLYIAVKW